MKLVWASQAQADMRFWLKTNRSIAAKIESLLQEIARTPFTGTGKPHALRENWSGYWSRRINGEHRLVYRIVGDAIEIAQCRWHYE